MITMVQPLPVGNALRLFLEPPAGAVIWRILRKGSDTFSGFDDPSALVVYEGDENVTVDAQFLPNNVMAFYRPYYTADGVTWTAGPTSYGTPQPTYEEHTTDALSLLRDRLEAGLKVEVERGNLVNDLGYLQVYTAPPSMDGDIRFPLVTLQLESESPAERAIGEDISGDEFDVVGFDYLDSEGWLAQVQISLCAWSLNPDERLELRKAIRRVIVANLAVFDDKGLSLVNVSFQDVDAVSGEYGAPVYQVMGTFSCLAPVRVGGRTPAIRDVISRSVNNG